jgi:hypothetical protein
VLSPIRVGWNNPSGFPLLAGGQLAVEQRLPAAGYRLGEHSLSQVKFQQYHGFVYFSRSSQGPFDNNRYRQVHFMWQAGNGQP